eukprot:scaffold11049_cov96-Isochrysis_galbana.AAC.7
MAPQAGPHQIVRRWGFYCWATVRRRPGLAHSAMAGRRLFADCATRLAPPEQPHSATAEATRPSPPIRSRPHSRHPQSGVPRVAGDRHTAAICVRGRSSPCGTSCCRCRSRRGCRHSLPAVSCRPARESARTHRAQAPQIPRGDPPRHPGRRRYGRPWGQCYSRPHRCHFWHLRWRRRPRRQTNRCPTGSDRRKDGCRLPPGRLTDITRPSAVLRIGVVVIKLAATVGTGRGVRNRARVLAIGLPVTGPGSHRRRSLCAC